MVTDRSHGKSGEMLRWLIGMALAALIAYFTTIGTMDKQITAVSERENNHFAEVLRRLEDLKSDLRELRSGR